MEYAENQFTILMADDDEDDRVMAKEAFVEAKVRNELHFVKNGEELMDSLHARGANAKRADLALPGFILLDLNMARKDGREALKEIKSDPELCRIPIVVLTTSKAEEDIYRSYDLGVNSFISKPVTFAGLVEVMKTVSKHWFHIVELPS